MASNVARRARIRSILTIIILATLPCYCLGLVLLQIGPRGNDADATDTPTATLTGEASPSSTLEPSDTPIIFPTATETATPTITWTPSVTPTLFEPPTRTPSPSPTASPTETETPEPATATPTRTPTSVPPTDSPTPEDD